ncbi:MAG: ATP synthase F1 subunit gamma [Bacteroidota bacterium]
MATNKSTLNRINTVTLTKQITQTMKMVAVSSLEKQKKEAAIIEMYYHSLQGLVSQLHPTSSSFDLPYIKVRKVERVLLIVLTTDKGLCGSFGSSVLSSLTHEHEQLRKEKKDVMLLPIGKKGVAFCQHHALPYLGLYGQNNNKSSWSARVKEISDLVLNAYIEEKYDEVICLYQSHAVSPSRDNVTVEKLLPVSMAAQSRSSHTSYIIYEPNPVVVHEAIYPQLVRTKLAHMIAVGQTAEQKARMMAMHQATDNAERLLKELKTLYNRTRQANITGEINEINAGTLSR